MTPLSLRSSSPDRAVERRLRSPLFAVLIVGGIAPLFGLFRGASPYPTTAGLERAEHAQLQCFAAGVLEHTEPRATIRFALPSAEADGGLAGHRLRYIVPGRQIVTAGAADYVASWKQPAPEGQIVWTGCGGVLVRR